VVFLGHTPGDLVVVAVVMKTKDVLGTFLLAILVLVHSLVVMCEIRVELVATD
jgi:hypothetical protein